jgi:hypothetical protein
LLRKTHRPKIGQNRHPILCIGGLGNNCFIHWKFS